jgi:acylpyruvate hydrolase
VTGASTDAAAAVCSCGGDASSCDSASLLLINRVTLLLSVGCSNLHHEVELGVVIGRGGSDIPRSDALAHVSGYFVALDMTARELQEVAKKAGEPWSTAKGYDTFCPVSEFIPASELRDPGHIDLWLEVNGVRKQAGTTSDMIFDLPTLISHISTIFKLEEGDFILTGTPSGVGPVKHGDVITAGIKQLPKSKL